MPPKFALGEALLALRDTPSDLITLDELALPYATALSRHVQHVPKQITSRSSKFLDVCARHARREANEDELRQAAVRQGFNNVIDAFHNVGDAEVDGALRVLCTARLGPPRVRRRARMHHWGKPWSSHG